MAVSVNRNLGEEPMNHPRVWPSKKLLTVKEAEAMTGRKASTWRKDILRRKVPYVKIGRQVRIPIEAIEDLMAAGYRPAIPQGLPQS